MAANALPIHRAITIFIICGNKATINDTCSYSGLTTKVWDGSETITFTTGQAITDGGITNPFQGTINERYEEYVNVHITAMAKDYTDGQDDLLDNMSHVFYATPGSSSTRIMAGFRPISDKFLFTVKVSVVCDSTWSGNDCNTGTVNVM